MFRGFSKIVFTVVRARQLFKSSYKQTTPNRHIVTRLIAFSSMSKAEEKMGSEKSKTKHKSEDQDGQEKPTKERVLRNNVQNADEETIRANRDLYLNMLLDEKRTKYKCKGKFETLDNVQRWPEYAHTVLQKKGKSVTPKKAVDKELNGKIALWRGDITTLEVDAVVNAANNSLMGGGGVDGAIHSAAGSKLLDECISLNRCDTGEAKISGGYKLPAKYIIHTVGPMGENKKKLASCYRRCLEIAKENNLKTVAFPCISTGIYGYDVKSATPVALEAVRDWLQDKTNENTVERVIFCVFLIGDVKVYEENLLKYFPVDKDNSRGDDKGTVQKDRKKAKANGKSKTDTGAVESKTDTQNNDRDEEKASGETEETVVIKENDEAVAYEKKSTEVKESDIPCNDVDDSSPAAKKKPPNPDDSPAAKKKPPNPDDKEASAGVESDGMKDKPDTDSDAKRETAEVNGEKKETMSHL